jgi:hypothetical protein
MIETALLKGIISVLFGLSCVWLVVVVVRRRFEVISRVLFVIVLLGAAYALLSQVKTKTVSFSDLKNRFFPEKEIAFTYFKEEDSAGIPSTKYIFPDPGPRLVLKFDQKANCFNIENPASVNRVLEYLGRPPVKRGVNELVSITGSQLDVNMYRWDDYTDGILLLERSLCKNKNDLETYHCIVAITIRRRY